MTLRNDSTPSDDDRWSASKRPFHEDLSPPSGSLELHSKILVDAYLQNCKRGCGEDLDLVTVRSKMSYDDQKILERMQKDYRTLFKRKLSQFGIEGDANDVKVRVLHPVVAIGPSHREYHLYLDIVSGNGRCWFLDYDAAAGFEKGPAALQLTARGSPMERGEMVMTRLFSEPAFHEALEKLLMAPFSTVLDNPRNFVAFGWIMQAIAMARNQGQPRDDVAGSLATSPVPFSTMRAFQWTGQNNPFSFECVLDDAMYIA